MDRSQHPTEPVDVAPIEVHEEAACTVVRVAGGLDARTAPALRRCLARLLDRGAVEVEVSLAGVPYCDDAGLGVLIGAHRRLRQDGGHLLVRQPAPQVRHTLEEHGLHRVLDIAWT